MRDDDPPHTVFKISVRRRGARELWQAAKLLVAIFAFFFAIFLAQYTFCKYSDSTKTWRECAQPDWRKP